MVEGAVEQWCQLMRALNVSRCVQPQPWGEFHVTLPQLRALGLLAAHPSGLSGRELATLLDVGPSAVTPLVDRLVEHHLVRRIEDRFDRRITRLHLTDEGQTLLTQMFAGKRELIATALRSLEPEELDLVTRAFEVLRQAVGGTRNSYLSRR